jgi:hypothetical protein
MLEYSNDGRRSDVWPNASSGYNKERWVRSARYGDIFLTGVLRVQRIRRSRCAVATQRRLVAIFDIHAPVSATSMRGVYAVFVIHSIEIKDFKQDVVWQHGDCRRRPVTLIYANTKSILAAPTTAVADIVRTLSPY